jgi:hypothetical protein
MRTWPFKDRPLQQEMIPVRGWLPIPWWQPTLAETLKWHGHRTFFVTDVYHEFVPPWMNFEGLRGFRWDPRPRARPLQRPLQRPLLGLRRRDGKEVARV